MAQKADISLPQSIDALHDWVRYQSDVNRKQVNLIPVVCRARPYEVFSGQPGILVNERENWLSIEFLPQYELSGNSRNERTEKKPGGLLFAVPTDQHDIWWLITAEKTPFVRRLQAFLQTKRRYIPQFWFANHEIKTLLDAMTAMSQCDDLAITQASLRSVNSKTSTIREHYDSNDIFGLASDWGHSIQTLHIECRGSHSLAFALFREGSVRVESRSWRRFETLVRPLLLNAVVEKLTGLEDRSRTSFEKLGRPIEIRYPVDIFLGREQNFQLVNALQASGTHSVAVRHINPYLHAVAVDLVEGGEVDIFVTSPKTVTVIPGYASTYGSLLRVTRAIFDSVSEGGTLVDNPTSAELTFEDVMGAASL